jgi:acyl transferase domain-containing protein/acyl carrier protein
MTNNDDFRQRIEKLSPKRLALLALEMHAKLQHIERQQNEPVAIIGMGCRIPGAEAGPEAFWELLRKGSDAIGEVPSERWDSAAYYDPDPDAPGRISTRWGGFLSKIDCFDAAFFGIAGREAISMDPQQRLLLEVCWESLENAGYSPRGLKGTQTGVFVGIGSTDYHRILLERGENAIDAYVASGSSPAIAAGRISYTLGLHGPSLAVDTACSASLVSVHLACQSLRGHECNIALAGGVNAVLLPDTTIGLSRAHMMAADGRCKTFDSRADGFVRGEGCGVVILKRLSDAIADRDHILAVIRSSAVNQDGRSSGITAPNGAAQELLLREALSVAGVQGHEVDYVETHGTGTSLGDPIEAHALAATYGLNRSASQPLVVGAVKTNIGHLESAAGIAGLIKAVLSLEHEQIPANLHFREMNPHIDWAGVPVRIPVEPVAWPRSVRPRRAGVSSFGFSGTNAHVIVEEAPEVAAAERERERPLHLLVLSARSEAALEQLGQRYGEALEGLDADLGDICYTAGAGRSHFTHRLAVPGSSRSQMRERLLGALPGKAVREREGVRAVFLFPGQGAQYAGMGRELYETQPVFRRSLEECAELLKGKLEKPLLEVLWGGSTEPLEQTVYTQPSLFAIEYALSELWRSWGIEPGAVLGHSVGEYVAACVAGMCTLEEGLQLIALRARLMQGTKGRGAMTAVRAGEDRVRLALEGLEGRVTVAAINAPESVVISGYEAEVEEAATRLSREGIGVQRLSVSHGFHSPQMEEMEEEFAAAAGKVRWKDPRVVLISSVTGRALAAGEMSEPGYWRRQVRQPVRFQEGIEALAGYQTFVEAGPGSTLSGLGQQCLETGERLWVQSLRKNRGEWEQMLAALGSLYVQGAEVNWAGYDEPYARRRVPLPTYPFERQRYWVEARPQQTAPKIVAKSPEQTDGWFHRIGWHGSEIPETPLVSSHEHWLVLGAPSDSISRAVAAAMTGAGRSCQVASEWKRDFVTNGSRPAGIVDLRAIQDAAPIAESCARLSHLIRHLAEAGGPDQRLWVITRGAQLAGCERGCISPWQVPLWGLGRSIASEHPDLWGGMVDLDPDAESSEQAELLCRHLLNPNGEDQTALRGGRRLVARLERQSVPAASANPLRADGTYLITGGLGDLGIEVARWMVNRGARRLILMGRTGPPLGSKWRELPPEHPRFKAVSTLLELERLGASIEPVALDVGDSKAVQEYFHQYQEECQPPFRGIVHAAGIAQPVPVADALHEDFASHFRAKVDGAWNLHSALEKAPLDFFILFSSASAVLNSPRIGPYAAANAFLDGLAHYRRGLGLTATSINWGAWTETGMLTHAAAGDRASSDIVGMTTKQGIFCFERLLGSELANVAVLPVDWKRWMQLYPAYMAHPFFNHIGNEEAHAPASTPPVTAKRKSFLDQFYQVPKGERSRLLLDHLTQLLAKVLGVPPASLNPHTDITEFGLDSLMALELRIQITADLGVSVPVVRLLEGLNLVTLQSSITGQLAEAVGHEDAHTPGPPPVTAKRKSFLDQFYQVPKERRSRLLLDHLTQLLAKVLGVSPASLNSHTDITEFGLDSLMALELRIQITADLGVSIPVVRLLEGLNLATLQTWITGQLAETVEEPQSVTVAGTETEFPLSQGQNAGLFGHKLLPEGALSNVALTAKASPPLNWVAFSRAVKRMTERHTVLRTIFVEDQEGQYVQRVLPSVSSQTELIDAAGWTDEEIIERLREDFRRPFDVSQPMFAIKVFRQREADVFYFKVDHLLIDHWSVRIFIEDLREIYSAEVAGRQPNLPPIEGEYRDYVEWEKNMMSGPAADRLWAYWQKKLSGNLPVLRLPSSQPRPEVLLAQCEMIQIYIDGGVFPEIQRAASILKCTVYTFLLAAFHVLLYMYTNQEDIIVGTSVAGRDDPRWQRTLGLFINVVPIRGDLSGSPAFSELVGRIREALLGAMEYSEAELVLKRLRLPRSLQRLPLFQAFFNYLTERTGGLRSLFMGIEDGEVQFGESTLRSYVMMPPDEGLFEISLQLAEVKDHLVVYLNYNVQILDAATANCMAESYRKILETVVQAPGMTIKNMIDSIALEPEREELII